MASAVAVRGEIEAAAVVCGTGVRQKCGAGKLSQHVWLGERDVCGFVRRRQQHTHKRENESAESRIIERL